jgi:hypothetical protein
MNELIINDRRVDLGENTNIGITFCANNIGELQNRQGNFSNTFKLPTTKTNKEVFEWSNLQTTASLMPYKKLKATYKQNGIEIIIDGVAEIQSTDNNYFYINVYSGNLDLIEAIGDLQVGELYINEIIPNWSFWNVITGNTLTKTLTYPLIDWRVDIDTFFNTSTIDVREMLPCIKVAYMFDLLAKKIGFIFKGNFFSSQNYLNMILTPNSFSIPKSDAVKSSQPLISTLSTYTNIPSGSSVSYVNFYPNFRNENNNPDFAIGVFKPTTSKVGKLKFAGNYDLFFSLTNTGGSISTPSPKKVTLYVSIVDVSGSIISYGPIVYGPYIYGLNTIVIDIQTPEMTFIANTIYKVKLTIEIPQTNRNQIVNLTDYQTTTTFLGSIGGVNSQNPSVVLPHYLEFSPSPKIAYGNNLDFTKIFTMKVKDVLKDILNMEGIIIQTNNFTKSIQFNNFDDVILNKSIAKDWSNKLQNATQMNFKFGNYAKKNNVKFKTESEFDSYFNLTDENLEVEKDVIKLGHDATLLGTKYSGFIIPKIDALKDASNEWMNPTWRLLYGKTQTTAFPISYTDGGTVISKSDNIPFCNFKNAKELIDENYTNIVSVLQNPKVLKIIAKLNVTDISDLDFTIPIQIQRPDLNISGYFYINKIENYKGGLTSCEIIEI